MSDGRSRPAARIAFVLCAGLWLAACAGQDYVRDGGSDDQRRKDEALCKSEVEGSMVKERRIADDRDATLGVTDQRRGRSQLPQQMSASDDRNRSNKLMDDCMSARGWRSNRRSWQFWG
jgi:hypothetical protein